MKQITPDKVRRDNSDVFRYSKELSKALRKEKFAKVRLDAFYKFSLVSGAGRVDPYPACDFRLDMEKFSATLEHIDRRVLGLFLIGLSAKEISIQISRSHSNVYYHINKIVEAYKLFYLEV